MDVCRRLLPVSLDGEEGQREGCALEAAGGVANEQPPSEGMAAAAAHGAGDRVDMEEGAVHRGTEEDLFFDLGTGDDTSSQDGDVGKSEDEDTSSNSSSPSKGTNSGDEESNDGKEGSSGSYDEQTFRNIADTGDQHTSLDEYWDIVNKSFVSEEDAFLFYNKYAWDKGFGVRKEKVRCSKPSGVLLFRRYVCARQGERHGKWLNKEDYSRRPRALTRCGCPALLDIRFDSSRGVWYVHNFIDKHNHRLATPDEVPFLWSHRKMKDFLKTEIMSMEANGIRTHVIRDVLHSRYGDKVGIVTKDVYNYSSRHKRSRIMDGDARTVLGLMLRRQREDPDFYFDYQVDDEDRLISMFWCDTQSCMDYQSFGDVVVFDSTYRMNRYKMPFVPFVGLNHHRSTTVFGCGIVGDERAETYAWVLRAFLKAMCQKKPQSIITDGDGAMIKAIRHVLPGVNHRICCWHVEKNVPKHVPSKSLKQFRKLLYYVDSAAFEERWNSFLANYQTEKNNDWLKMMYKNKEL